MRDVLGRAIESGATEQFAEKEFFASWLWSAERRRVTAT